MWTVIIISYVLLAIFFGYYYTHKMIREYKPPRGSSRTVGVNQLKKIFPILMLVYSLGFPLFLIDWGFQSLKGSENS